MEHEVFVPVPAEALRHALGDPARVARCVPGLQQDADESSGPLTGRLRVRIDGHTITYRGTLRVTGRPDGTFAVEGEGTEARGTGAVKVVLTARLKEADGGTTVTYTGTASGEGRVAELDAQATLSASHRLLDRFTTRLAETPAGDTRAERTHGGDGRGRPRPGRHRRRGRCRRRRERRAVPSVFDTACRRRRWIRWPTYPAYPAWRTCPGSPRRRSRRPRRLMRGAP